MEWFRKSKHNYFVLGIEEYLLIQNKLYLIQFFLYLYNSNIYSSNFWDKYKHKCILVDKKWNYNN